MSLNLATIRARVRANIRELGPRRSTTGVVEIDNQIADLYLEMAASLPPPRLLTTGAFTIAANARTFALPSAGAIEYGGMVEIQLQSDRSYLKRRSRDELIGLHDSDTSTVGTGKPSLFALYEDASQVVQGLCWPRSKDAELCDLFAAIDPTDIRDAANMEAAGIIQFSRIGGAALVLFTSARLVIKITDDDLATRRLNRAIAGTWEKAGHTLLYQEEVRRHNAEAVGYVMRMTP